MTVDVVNMLARWTSGEPVAGERRTDVVDLLNEVVHLQAGRDEDTARLRAENEQQAREVAYLRSCVPPTHPSHYGYEAWEERLRAEVERERAAVVAWLRKHWSEVLEQTPQQTAKLIERGEHRREEKA